METKPIPQLSEKHINRFWSKVGITAQENKCWEWQASKTHDGYGRFTIRGTDYDKGYTATRVGYFLEYGIDPGELKVCHSCDNTSCCNPKHYFLGTNKENTQDMLKKGRHIVSIGVERPEAKFTEYQVREIRSLYPAMMQKDIATKFGVVKSTICEIISGKRYRNVN